MRPFSWAWLEMYALENTRRDILLYRLLGISEYASFFKERRKKRNERTKRRKMNGKRTRRKKKLSLHTQHAIGLDRLVHVFLFPSSSKKKKQV